MILLGFGTPMAKGQSGGFNLEKDLLLVQYDFKTDVDDLHSVAAFATLLRHPDYTAINYHAVAGAYGTQKGPYIPPNPLMEQVFGERWSDAHQDFGRALSQVVQKAMITLKNDGDVWIAEGGQSDFSAALVRAIRQNLPAVDSRQRIHLVQHSSWNEQAAFPEHLDYVKTHTHYQKIPDGNAKDNGTPCFRSDNYIDLKNYIKDQALLATWNLAIEIGNHYNGLEGRYLNKSVQQGGLDFSDFSEVCWIMGMDGIADADEFFTEYVQNN